MEITKQLKVPTGDILIVKGEKGLLELVSLGDYGKDVNVKCDAMGLSRNIEKVEHAELLPLTKKWVVTISTQYGCSMGCMFCDVPKVGSGKNATENDLINQVLVGLNTHPEIFSTERLNIHYARMGEPTWNPNVLKATKRLKEFLNPNYRIHPVISTMMPKKNIWLEIFLRNWMDIKNNTLYGNAGLQLSINSTNENERNFMFNNNCCTLEQISNMLKGIIVVGRKITLNFAIADYEIDPDILLKYFDPNLFLIKLTPMHKTESALDNNISTIGDYTTYYPYQKHERRLKEAGYDVIVFIASKEEDEGLITCGNAILSGSLPKTNFSVVDVKKDVDNI